MKKIVIGLGLTLFAAGTAIAGEVRITPDIQSVEFSIGDQDFVIERIQDTENRLNDEYTKTSRACPPFCIQPIEVAPSVTTVGELELIQFLESQVQNGTGLLIDARLPDFFNKGTIPGSINIPFTVLDYEGNEYLETILMALGAEKTSDGNLDFTNAKELALFCNGHWCGQSPRAIHNLIAAGYPPEKLYYYRGGMQAWLSVGLTKHIPG